jgi:hypothetical protein
MAAGSANKILAKKQKDIKKGNWQDRDGFSLLAFGAGGLALLKSH